MSRLIHWIEEHSRSVKVILVVMAVANGVAAYKTRSRHPLLGLLAVIMAVVLWLLALLT